MTQRILIDNTLLDRWDRGDFCVCPDCDLPPPPDCVEYKGVWMTPGKALQFMVDDGLRAAERQARWKQLEHRPLRELIDAAACAAERLCVHGRREAHDIPCKDPQCGDSTWDHDCTTSWCAGPSDGSGA